MIKAIFFDFDGTLVDTLPFCVNAYDQALQRIGFKFDEKKIAQTCFGKKEDFICNSLGVPEKTELFAQTYFNAVKELFKNAPLFDNTMDTLNFIKSKGIKVIIITFAYRWYIDQMLKQYGLENYFDLVISRDDVKNPKPNPEAVLKAAEKLGIKPEDTIVVGDSKNDVLMGKSAGSKTVLFTRKEYDLFYDPEELKQTNPDNIVDEIYKLKEIIELY